MRDLYVVIDELEEATVLFGRSLDYEVAPGNHRVKITNRLFSKVEEINLADGETAVFDVANVSAGCLFAPLIVLGGTGAYRVSLIRES